jgi:uncharacterized protein YpmB
MNNERLTQSAKERQDKAEDIVFIILVVFTVLLLAFSFGYYVAMNEALALIKTI